MAGGFRTKPNEIAGRSPAPPAEDAHRQKARKERERSKKSAALDTTANPGIDRADKKAK